MQIELFLLDIFVYIAPSVVSTTARHSGGVTVCLHGAW